MARNARQILVAFSALCLVLPVGCQSVPNRPSFAPPGSDSEPNVRLTSHQVADIQIAFGRTLEARGEIAGAAQAYIDALKNDASRADACVRIAKLSAQQGKSVEAADYYYRAIKLQPDNADIYCDVGYTHYLQHEFPDAEQAFRKCLSLNPDHARAHNNLGLLLGRTQREAEALSEFRQAGCSETDAYANLAYALALNGSLQQARSGYERALALQPKSDAAQRGLSELNALAAKLNPDENSREQGVRTAAQK